MAWEQFPHSLGQKQKFGRLLSTHRKDYNLHDSFIEPASSAIDDPAAGGAK
jgi:hypothetical protein